MGVGAALSLGSLLLGAVGPVAETAPRPNLAASASAPAAASSGAGAHGSSFVYDPAAPLDFLMDERNDLPPSVQSFLDEAPVDGNAASHRKRLAQLPSKLDVTIRNAYTRGSPIQTGEYAYPWTYLAEPYRAHALTMADGHPEATFYKWIVDGHTQGYGTSVDALWTSAGWKSVVLVEKVNGTTSCVLAAKVMVKYTRREIRSLSDQDREAFFQAAQVMQRVPTEVGQRLFGSDYKSKDYFNRVHLYYGGTADCDHWHQGAGFVTSHMAFSLEFEKALQSVYPSTSVPYWDFTMESTFYEPATWRQSPIFADDWFGNASPDNDLHTVVEGRWAFVPAMTNARNFSEVTNSYGVLRAPWNNDPTPFLKRHSKIYGYENNMKPSGCKEYAVAMKKTTWMSMSRQLNSAAHGHIHETVGGSWNHIFADENNGETSPAVLTFAHEIQALSKELWRAGYVECPGSCDMADSWKSCQCQCTPKSVAGKTSYEILDDAGVLSAVHYYDMEGHIIEQWKDGNGTAYYTLPGYTTTESRHIYDELLKVLCSPGHIGDMFQATSTNDITFWVLHPTVDRLWHYKRLGNLANYDETWDPYHKCYGHNPTNYQPFKNLFDKDNMFYTNEELYEAMRPNTATLPYTYDHFLWPHCAVIGHAISNEQ